MDDPTEQRRHLTAVCEIARVAGQAILEVYGRRITVERKADDSPLTEADRMAHAAIVRGLAEYDAAIPVLSEESAPADHAA